MKITRRLLCRGLRMAALAAIPVGVVAQTTIAIPTYYIHPAQLKNVAVRSTLAPGESLITGFVISQPSTATILARAAGTALAPLGVTGAMQNPRLQIINTAGQVVAANDDWSALVPPSSAQNPAWSVQHASEMVGAFPFPTASRDAAIVTTLPPGAYTLVISGSTNADAGTVLAELYQLPVAEALSVALARGETPQSHIVNLSSRGRITGNTGMIGGFNVGGTGRPLGPLINSPFAVPEVPPFTRRFLIRVVGPALAGFSVTDSLVDPTLELARTDGTVIQSNDNWDADPAAGTAIREASASAGAFPLASGSRDAAVVATLPEGSYTVIARGANGATGAALIEIYELEN